MVEETGAEQEEQATGQAAVPGSPEHEAQESAAEKFIERLLGQEIENVLANVYDQDAVGSGEGISLGGVRMPRQMSQRELRLLALALFAALGLVVIGFLAGFQYARLSSQVERVNPILRALRPGAAQVVQAAAAASGANEADLVHVYDAAAPAVVNVITVTLESLTCEDRADATQGSGFFIDRDGYILTNNHVVRDGFEYCVALAGQAELVPAQLVGADPANDLAVLRIDPSAGKFSVVTFGNPSRLHVGQSAIAIGNPFGLEHTMTVGYISALGRNLEIPDGNVIPGVIQTDASINPGNSGGPLLNLNGEVIGVNTQIFSPSGSSAGLGFAIPIDFARTVAQNLVKG
ncbi:MAG: S1C family serine protease [Anaerolineae bacterium]